MKSQMKFFKDKTNDAQIKKAAALVSSKSHLLICAGAGMGVDSGLPDFRGKDGFWKAYPMFKSWGQSYRDVAQPKLFKNLPSRAWGFYGSRTMEYRSTTPHQGFDILRKWNETHFDSSFIFTSNVDGQFQKTGFSSERNLECHGSIHHHQCLNVCCKKIWSFEGNFVVDERLFAQKPFPKCPHCGGASRPNIRMFGDREFAGDRSARQEIRYRDWLASIDIDDLLIIEVGAGIAIQNVRLQAKKIGASLIRINPNEAEVKNSDDCSIPLGALEALLKIEENLND